MIVWIYDTYSYWYYDWFILTCIYVLTCIYDFLLGDNTASQADHDSDDIQIIKKNKNRRKKISGQANSQVEEKPKKKSKKEKLTSLQGDDSPGKFVILFMTCDKYIKYIFTIITHNISYMYELTEFIFRF